MDHSAEITQLLERVAAGDDTARERLWECIYPEVRRCADVVLAYWRRDGVIAGSDLAQGVFERLDHREFYVAAQNRRYFFGAVAKAMTRLLVDEYRKQAADRRGGGRLRLCLSEIDEPAAESTEFNTIEFDETLEVLRRTNPELHEVFVLRCLLGRSTTEVAADLGIDESTVRRKWRTARAWMQRELMHGSDPA